ncbi:MAG: cell wall hydrolase [Dehalococcoidales bacterium]|nr:cell wall hydrolase [Dehalococcoidales bacterium]
MINELLIVACTVFLEARGEPHAGRLMVAEVIRNRANTQKSCAEVCLKPRQFSCWNRKRPEKVIADVLWTISNNELEKTAWRDCVELSKEIMSKDYQSTTPATHYYNPKLARPKWAKKMRVIATVGNHLFLKEK